MKLCTFLYHVCVARHKKTSHGRRQCFLQTGLVYLVFDRVDAFQNEQTQFCYFRHQDPVQHVYIVIVSLIRFSNCYLTRKNTIYFEFHSFTRCHDFANINEYNFCNNLTSLGSLTAIEI